MLGEGNICSENLLVDSNLRVKVAGFGLAGLAEQCSLMFGPHLAPELLVGGEQTTASDICKPLGLL